MIETDIRQEFEDALRGRGIVVPPGGVIADGKLRRIDAEGMNGKSDAAYVLYDDPPAAGGFENWKDGQGWENWKPRGNGNGKGHSSAEDRQLRERWAAGRKAREEERKKNQEKAAAIARKEWAAANPAPSDHAYLVRKKILAHDLRVNADGRLLIPMQDSAGELWNLQRIDQGGEKRFLPGGRAEGLFFTIGPDPDGTVIVAEGVSTALSIFEATGIPVVAAMSAGNLLAAGRELRKKCPKARLVYFADNDHPDPNGVNVGVSKATEAAKATGGVVVMSPTAGDDANDLYVREGARAVQATVEAGRDNMAEVSSGQIKAGFNLTDMGNAKRLVQRFGGRIRYCGTWKCWLVYDGTRWTKDETGEIIRLAKQTAQGIYGEAGQAADESARKKLAAYAMSSESEKKLKAMVSLAQTEEGIPVRPGDLDRHRNKVNVLNGTINTITGKLHPHDPADLITQLAPVSFDEEADATRWKRFLLEVFKGRQGLIDFMHRFLGYCLTGETKEQAFVIGHGGGGNGKSVLLSTVTAVLGDYATSTPFSTFTLRRNESVRNDLACLHSVRLVTASEAAEGMRFDEELIKRLTGDEKIKARFLFSEYFEYDPSFKLFLATNHRPRIKGTDHAIWRRIRLVPFDAVFTGDDRDPDLKGKLIAEASGILTWLVLGAILWRDMGLGYPEEVKRATEEYQAEEDTLGCFLSDRCKFDPTYMQPARLLYLAFKDYCGGHVISEKAFSGKLEKRGYRKDRDSSGVFWYGLELLGGQK